MEKRTTATFIVLAALILPSLPASATTTASATAVLSNFQVHLIDLAPDDGIAPSITFTPGKTFSQAVAGNENHYQELPDPFAENFESTANSQGSANASLVGDARGAGATITTGATALGDSGTTQNEAYAWVFFGESGFTLSPHTEVEFAGTVTLTVDVSDVAKSRADASVGFEFTSFAGPFGEFLAIEANALPGQTHVSETQFFPVFFPNNTDVAQDVVFGGVVESRAVLNSIPEPPAGLLLATGSALVLLSSRRRRPAIPAPAMNR